jgi:hypothetical protein
MQTKRNYANIARQVIDPKEDGQNVQQFMSDSPWEAQAVIQKVQQEIAGTVGLAAFCSWMRVRMRKLGQKVRGRDANTMGDWAKSR